MDTVFFSQAISSAIGEEMERDDSVVLIGQDIGLAGGAFGATKGLWGQYGSKRVIESPISENSVVGMGVGASMTGLRPIIEIMYMDFVGLAYDQILNKVSKLFYVSGGNVSLPMVIRLTAGGGRNYGPDHSQSLEAIFNHIPGLVVVVPSNPNNAKALLKASIRCDDPVIFVEYRMNYGLRGEVSTDTNYTYPLGKAELVLQGNKLTIISYGRMLNLCLDVIHENRLDNQIDLIDLLTIKPLDVETIGLSIRKTKNVLVVDEGYRTNGVAAEIITVIQENYFFDLDAPIRRLTGKDIPIPFSENLESSVLPVKDTILRDILLCLTHTN